MVPLLTLGIPGSASTAVFIGALMMHNLVPGPLLFSLQPQLVYGLFASMLVANIVMLGIGAFGSRLWIKVSKIPSSLLMPLILSVAFIGSFAEKGSFFDVGACFGFGVLGWLLKRRGYPMAPIVLGMVLGKIAEVNFCRAVMMDGFGIFFTRPASVILLVISIAAIAYPVWKNMKIARKSVA